MASALKHLGPAWPPWRAPPYTEIRKSIGEVLKRQYKPQEELPDQLLTLLRQVTERERTTDSP
jgi:hypothetical protein